MKQKSEQDKKKPVNYLIVTTEILAEKGSLNDFKKHKETEGYIVEVTSVNEIYESYGKEINSYDVVDFYTSTLNEFYTSQYRVSQSKELDLLEQYVKLFFKYQYRRDYLLKAFQIRAYIKKRFSERLHRNAPFYVLLAGDVGHGVYGKDDYESVDSTEGREDLNREGKKLNFVPAFYDFLLCQYPEFGNSVTRDLYAAFEEMQILTDFYYANLSADSNTPSPCWDAIVARIPTSDPDEMKKVIDKLKKYKSADYQKKGITIGSDQKIFDNGKYMRSNIYENAADNAEEQFSNITNSCKESPQDIVTKLNNANPPLFAVVYRGDAFECNAWAVSYDSNVTQGGEGGFSQTSIQKLKNHLPFAVGLTAGDCYLDRYTPPYLYDMQFETKMTECLQKLYKDDYPSGNPPPIGKFWVLGAEEDTKHSALTFLGATRVTVEKFNQFFYEQIYKNFESGKVQSIGELVKKSIRDTYSVIAEKNDSSLLVSYADDIKMYMLLGDPSLTIPTD